MTGAKRCTRGAEGREVLALCELLQAASPHLIGGSPPRSLYRTLDADCTTLNRPGSAGTRIEWITIGEMRVALSLRCYLFQDDGTVKRIPRRVVDGLVQGQDAMPEYANSVQRIATAVVDNDNGKAFRIVDARGEYWTFDEEGKINKGLSESFAEVMSMVGDERRGNHGKVVSITPALKRRDFQQKHRWHLIKEHLDWIAADIWPSENGRPAHITSATGKVPRKPPLTYDAKQAFREIDVKLGTVIFELEKLSEPGLKGLAFEAREKAEEEAVRDVRAQKEFAK
jgi:hypothetical protein